jgi:hypothetical protein
MPLLNPRCCIGMIASSYNKFNLIGRYCYFNGGLQHKCLYSLHPFKLSRSAQYPEFPGTRLKTLDLCSIFLRTLKSLKKLFSTANNKKNAQLPPFRWFEHTGHTALLGTQLHFTGLKRHGPRNKMWIATEPMMSTSMSPSPYCFNKMYFYIFL